MNNNEILKIKELKTEQAAIINELRKINPMLEKYKYSFKYKESIEALKRIDIYCHKQSERLKELDKNIIEISETLDCDHKIAINHLLYYECSICKKNINTALFPQQQNTLLKT